MARNIEIKARVADPDALRTRAGALSDTAVEILEQRDIFFGSANGRLKLRRFTDGQAELIHYHRLDRPEPRESNYQRVTVSDPEALEALLTDALGTCGVVRKTRHLYRVGQTRIHLDEVVGLGHFLELEVVLAPGQSGTEGRSIAERLLAQLGIAADALVAGAYRDLLEQLQQSPGSP